MENKKEQQQIGIFLNLCGPEIIEIFNTLGLSAEDKRKYNAVVATVEEYCTPKRNEVYETFKFNKRKQEEGESFDSFLLDLRKLVKPCEYKDEDRMLRDKIVIGTNNSKLQKKLLETEKLDLTKTITIARNFELVEIQVNDIEKQQQTKVTKLMWLLKKH